MANSEFASLIDDMGLEDLPTTKATAAAAPIMHACIYCGGSGKFHGPSGRLVGDCFACKGRGRMPMNSTQQRERRVANKARASKASETREANERKAREVNAALPIFFEVVKLSEWHEFAASLIEQHRNGRTWSDKQVTAITASIAKVEASRARRAAEVAAAAPDMLKLVNVFETAVASGMKRPVLSLRHDVTVSMANANGRNAGFLYVKQGGEYLGKISPAGVYQGRPGDCALDALQDAAGDPVAAAIRYGRETGTCACCRRTLTNKDSIELGIGPICADKFFRLA